MIEHETLYSVLGVSPTATQAEIRLAYLAAVARYHPDKHSGNPLEELASEKLVALNRAYEVLSDSARRAEYDASHDGRAGGSSPTAGQSGQRLLKFVLLSALVMGALRSAGALVGALRGAALVVVLLVAATALGLWLRKRGK